MLEEIVQSLLLLAPLLGAAALGRASMSMLYMYLIAVDFFKCWGHCNFEFVPAWFRNLPGAKYLLYTPSSVLPLEHSPLFL
jgi:sterol desaturase/sphingolipid hydroxylase (fatty acid hydroxylase superfamily)